MAFQLNPYPPDASYYWVKGFALYAARNYAQAVEALQNESCRGSGAQRILAAALAQLGRDKEAQAAAQRFLHILPQFSVSDWIKTQPFRDPRDLQHFVDGYIKAGLPE
jgi:hypothetical protein